MFKKKPFKLLLPFVTLTIMLSFFLIHSSAETTENLKSSTIKSNTDLMNYINKYNSLILDIKQELINNDYPVVIDYSISSDQKIELLIKTNEENTKKTKEQIAQLTTEIIKGNKFNPSLFKINITNYYEPTQNTNSSSTRLSYNDLIGYIGEELFAKYDIPFSLQYNFSPEKIKIALNLPTNSEIGDIEIQNTILEVIKQQGLNPDIFQIDITKNIKTD